MKVSLVVGVISALRIALGALMQGFILASLGIGAQTDALLASAIVPTLAVVLIAPPLNQVLVPLFSSAPGPARNRDAWTSFVLLAASLAAIAAALAATASIWVAWITPGFSAEVQALTAQLTRIQLVGMVFSIPLSVVWSLHCARGRLVWAEAALLISTLIALVVLVDGLPRYGVQFAALTSTFKAVLDVALLAYILGRPRGFDLRSPLLLEAWRRVRYLIAGAAYFGTDSIVNQVLASYAPPGSLSAFLTSQQLYNVLSQLVHKSIAAPLMPLLARDAERGQWVEFRRAYLQRMLWAGLLALALIAGLLALGRFALGLLVGRGGITGDNVALLWQTMILLSGMCVGGLIGQVTVSALHTMGDTKTPTQLGALTYTLYIPLKVLAFGAFGLAGMSIATSLFYLANAAGQFVLLERALARRGAPALAKRLTAP